VILTSKGDEPVRVRPLIAVLVALAAAGCGSGGQDRSVPPRNDRTQVYALLASNELVGVGLSPSRLTVRLRLGEGLDQFSPGRLLATSPDGTTVYVLVREPKRLSITVVAAASGRLRMRIPLPAGLDGRSLVVGPRSGTLYVLANREGTRRNHVMGLESSAQLLVVDPARDASGRASSSGRSRAGTGSSTPPRSRRTSGRSTSPTTARTRRAPTGLHCPAYGAVAARRILGPAAYRMSSTGICCRSRPVASWPRPEVLAWSATTHPGGS
jgi:hypothetical protein